MASTLASTDLVAASRGLLARDVDLSAAVGIGKIG